MNAYEVSLTQLADDCISGCVEAGIVPFPREISNVLAKVLNSEIEQIERVVRAQLRAAQIESAYRVC
jgi:hypothetical protein